MSRLPLELHAVVTAADGSTYRWDQNQHPGSRPKGLSFSDKIGEGFATSQTQLARRIDLDYPDLGLGDTVSFVGSDGSVAWEGRVSATPRELGDDRQSIGVTMTGWIAHAKDRKFSEIYVDRDMGAWGGMSTARKAQQLTASWTPYDAESTSDPVDNETAVATAWTGGWGATFFPTAEAWYDAGPGNRISTVGYSWERESGNVNQADTNWGWTVYISPDTSGVGSTSSGNLRAAGPATLQTLTSGAPHRFAILSLAYTGGPVSADGSRFGVRWTKLAGYGPHGLTTYTGEPGEPPGVLASDVIKDIARRHCPHLNTDGVQATNYVIQHLAYKDRIYPYDAFLDINKYHLWFLGVWENKTLTYRPYDLLDYDWEVRTDVPDGAKFTSQGPSVDDLFNGITVTYKDLLSGITNTLTPDDDSTLRWMASENPWNKHGIQRWDEITLSTPTTQAQALEIGRAALADRNTPKTPGTISVTGYIRDRMGAEQPAWKVRAGDTIAITNFPNDTPRLIVEKSWDDDSRTLTMSIDRPFALVDAYLDRLNGALGAKGLA